MASSKIQFVNVDPDAIVLDIKTRYETLTGKVIQPAQVEMLVFNSIGYRLSLVMNQINESANACLVAFATGPALDKLAELVGVKRLLSAPASCVIRFNLVAGHGALNIPSGIRVQSTDGQAIFITTESVAVLVTDNTVDIAAECTVNGKVGNGYAIGAVSVILDPQPYVTTAANTDITKNGTDDETDAELRARILLAPSQFSVAGPSGAYKFFAMSAHASIVDVAVTIGHDSFGTIIPGQVDIFPLMDDGNPPSTSIINAINAICNDTKIRPLTDTVVIKAPSRIDYPINVNLVLLTSAVQADVVAVVQANLEAYRDERKNRLGIDVVRSQIVGRCQVPGVYSVVVANPTIDIVAAQSEFTNCVSINIAVIGTHDE
jgi:phage-related baseplate assembly protein